MTMTMRIVLSICALALLITTGRIAYAETDAGPTAAVVVPATANVAAIVEPTPVDAWTAFGAGRYALGIATLLLLALGLLRKALPALFSSDLAGAATALASSFLAGIITAASTGADVGWSMVKASFVVAVLAMGGYSVLWRKIARPLLYRLASALGWDSAARALEMKS